jgi:nucleotide sugar dehydrogenase
MIYRKVGVIGLGYVGLPLVVQLIKKKFDVVGFDINSKKINKIRKLQKLKKAKLTSNYKDLKDRNFFIICVPTPINKKKKPDLKALKLASQIVGKNLNKKDIVVYESTVYPGCTDELCIPILEKFSGLKINKSFYCGYSPERINPEDKKHTLENIIKVTSGSNKYSSKIIDNFYKRIIPAGTYCAESIKIAESAKIIENVQRDLNIALVNELSLIFDRMHLDTYKILKAASTKWNFINYKPGLVGGHCIGVDPYYLTYKSEKLKYKPKIILAGRKVNDNMPNEIAKNLINNLKKINSNIKSKKVLIIGYSFKENSKDIRNTKVLDLFKNLKRKINHIDIYDPIVDAKEIFKEHQVIVKNQINKKKFYDALILAVPHEKIIKDGKHKILSLLKKDAYIIDIKKAL